VCRRRAWPPFAGRFRWCPGASNFSARGGTGDLRQLLRETLPEAGSEFAHGHDRATGGSLEHEEFELLLRRLRSSSQR
jgi:single-stranded DNA-specific DHH superfamily exonuclease